jgi:hypothetical protein
MNAWRVNREPGAASSRVKVIFSCDRGEIVKFRVNLVDVVTDASVPTRTTSLEWHGSSVLGASLNL